MGSDMLGAEAVSWWEVVGLVGSLVVRTGVKALDVGPKILVVGRRQEMDM